MTAIRFSGELTYIGTTDALVVHRLPLITLPWVNEGPALPVLMGRNGRPRTAVTMPGHNRGVKPQNAGRKFHPDPLTNDEVLRLLNSIPQQTKHGASWPVGVRNRALLALLWRTGLRISEALDLQPHHVDYSGYRVTVLNGKGGKRRTVGIDAGGLLELQHWLFERARLQVPVTAPLFCTTQNPGKGNRMNSAYVRQILHEYGRRAGIPKRVHPHGFRHALAVSLVREGFSLPNVQAQLGHSNVATTAVYLRSMGADEAFDKVAERRWPA